MVLLNTFVSAILVSLAVKYSKCDLNFGRDLLEICIDCIKTLQNNNTCGIPLCERPECKKKIDLNSFVAKNKDRPTLLCREDNTLTFQWSHTKNTYYFLEYSREGVNDSKITSLTHCNYQTISGLNPDQKYEIRLFSYSVDSNILFKNQKLIGVTTKALASKTSVENLSYTLTLENESYKARITWKSGTDLSCFYEIVWYEKVQTGSYLLRRVNLKKQLVSEFNMSHLSFGKKYDFAVMSIDRNGHKESLQKWLHITIPTCLDATKNISICPPNVPKNLTLSRYLDNQTNAANSNDFMNLKLTWNKPKMLPQYYNATLISPMDNSTEEFSYISKNVSGSNNWVTFENLNPTLFYKIKLVAYSNKGGSNAAYIEISKENKKNIQKLEVHAQSFTHWIWIALIFATLLFIVILVFKAKIRKGVRKLLSMKQRMNGVIVKYVVTDNEDLKWELNETKLVLDKVIGAGAFGIVQKGRYSLEGNKKTEVAVKTLKARPSDEQIAQFYNEIEIMKSVPRHQHIVYLIGVITRNRTNNPLMLVEYCEKGNLQSFLKNVWLVWGDSKKEMKYSNINRPSDSCNKFPNKLSDVDTSPFVGTEHVLQSKDLLSFARQIVVGMEFLTSLKIIHRDLAARNILLTEDLTIKISDFGLSRDIYTSNVYQKVTGGKLPFRWMAIESLTHQIYTTESDVWSFGIVLWEIVTLGANPYPTVNSEDLIPLLKENYRMKIPINCSKELYHIMLGCWQASPHQRPTFSELKDTFDKLLESEMQYISLEDARKLDLIYYENIKNNSVGLGFSNRYIVQYNKSMLVI